MIDLKPKHKKWKPKHGKFVEWWEMREGKAVFRCREYWDGRYEEKDISEDMGKVFWETLRWAIK